MNVMLLPNIIIPKLANECLEFYSPDTLADCDSRRHFKNYPHDVNYKFNSRGFRDQEWPDDLENAIWCLGDSATTGIGAPIEHSWPSQLSKITGIPTINLGIRAIDNYTISTIAREIIVNVQPKNMLILWAYLERRPLDKIHNVIIDYSQQQVPVNDYSEHYDFFKKCILNITEVNIKTNIVHSLQYDIVYDQLLINDIWNSVRDPAWPKTLEDMDTLDPGIVDELHTKHKVYDKLTKILNWFEFKREFIKNEISKVDRVDLARDGFHWDIETNKSIANKFKDLLVL